MPPRPSVLVVVSLLSLLCSQPVLGDFDGCMVSCGAEPKPEGCTSSECVSAAMSRCMSACMAKRSAHAAVPPDASPDPGPASPPPKKPSLRKKPLEDMYPSITVTDLGISSSCASEGEAPLAAAIDIMGYVVFSGTVKVKGMCKFAAVPRDMIPQTDQAFPVTVRTASAVRLGHVVIDTDGSLTSFIDTFDEAEIFMSPVRYPIKGLVVHNPRTSKQK
jgi:hypothetical protein